MTQRLKDALEALQVQPIVICMQGNPYSAPQHPEITRVGKGKGAGWLLHVAPWVLLSIAPLLLLLMDTLLPNRRLPLGEWPEPSWIDHSVTGLVWLQIPMAILSIVLAWRKMSSGIIRWLMIGVAIASVPAMTFFGLAVVMAKTGKWL